MARYTLRIRADRKDMVEAIISRIPSHYQPVWVTITAEGKVYHQERVRGAVEELQPVGQLASLVAEPTEEGVKPAWYQMSGEFNERQLAAIKAAMTATRLTKDVTWREAEEIAR